jgi:hypothetical protein
LKAAVEKKKANPLALSVENVTPIAPKKINKANVQQSADIQASP